MHWMGKPLHPEPQPQTDARRVIPIVGANPTRKYQFLEDEEIACIYLCVASSNQSRFSVSKEKLLEDLEDECAHRGLDYTFWEK
jgi:hypothetical protein